MRNQEKNSTLDERTGIRNRIRNSRNREKALYDFSNVPEGKSQRMTQNNLSKK